MPDTPTPQTPPVQPPADDGVFKVQHSDNAQPPQAQPVLPDGSAPGQVITPTTSAAEAQIPVSSGPDLSKIPQDLINLATEVTLPPEPDVPATQPPVELQPPQAPQAPQAPQVPPPPPTQPLPPAQN